MDIQKQSYLQQTSDLDHIIFDSFLQNGQFTDLYLYPNQIKIIQKNKVLNIPISLDLTFIIIYDLKGIPNGLQFTYSGLKITLNRDFWSRALEWETILIQYVTRGDFHNQFKPTRKIGKGTFASVYEATDLQKGSNQRKVAIKSFLKEAAFKADGRAAIQNEIKLMRRINSTNIVKLYGVYSSTNSLYLSIEHLPGTTLDIYLKKNPTPSIQERKIILKSLLVGIADLQKLKIVHRDLKPENIMIDNTLDSIKIVDFGLATHIDEQKYIFVRCGTPGYVAPEIIRIKDIELARMRIQSDIFSLGAIYYQIIYGKPLFLGKDAMQILYLNRQCKVTLPVKQDIGVGQLQLLVKMLKIQPSQRISAQMALKSDFFKDQNNRQPFCELLKTISSTNWSSDVLHQQ